MRDVTVKESPPWLKKCLESIGQKSINNIVDAGCVTGPAEAAPDQSIKTIENPF